MTSTALPKAEQQPEILFDDREPGTPAELLVNRHEITFATLGPDRVRFEAPLHNVGDEVSAPTMVLLEAAPLGAFVPWQPLVALPVPALAGGESHVLRYEAARPKVQALGPPDRVPPRQLLTALDPGDRPAPQRRTFSDMVKSWVRKSSTATLPANVMELLGRGDLNYAGNLNVFVEGRAIERHLAGPLRLRPGQVNIAMFVVGSRPDAFRFHIGCSDSDWEVALYDLTESLSVLASKGHDQPLKENEWLEFRSMRLLNLLVHPPAHCQAGKVDVEVEQRSSQQVAMVEFSLDPRAAGPGCFTL